MKGKVQLAWWKGKVVLVSWNIEVVLIVLVFVLAKPINSAKFALTLE